MVVSEEEAAELMFAQVVCSQDMKTIAARPNRSGTEVLEQCCIYPG